MHDTLNDRFRKKKKMLWHGLRYFYFTLLEIEKNRKKIGLIFFRFLSDIALKEKNGLEFN